MKSSIILVTKRLSVRRFSTFGAVGLFNTAAFFMLSNIFNQIWAFGETSAAYLSYAILVPVSFIGHRRLTFRSDGRISREWLKFCVIQAVTILVIWTVTSLPHAFPFVSGWPAFVIISVLIPILNFIVFQRWVFSAKSQRCSGRT